MSARYEDRRTREPEHERTQTEITRPVFPPRLLLLSTRFVKISPLAP